MNTADPYEIMKSIAEMDPWERARMHNWVLVPQMSAEPFVVSVQDERKRPGLVAGRLLLFPGMSNFRDFVISHQVKDFGVAMSPIDFRHYEAVALKKGGVEILVYEPGFVPLPPSDEDRAMIALLLNECRGFLLRLEEDPDLPMKYVSKQSMFARKEVVEGVWVDGPARVQEEEVIQQTESIALSRDDCKKAKELPLFPKEIWEVDFALIPTYHTRDKRPRFLYLLAAVNSESGERMVWERLSVDGKEDGLKRLWEGHAQRVLDAIVKRGRVPGEIHVRSPRVMRFLRPLGMQLPFKLVQHAKLPALESVLDLAVQTRKV